MRRKFSKKKKVKKNESYMRSINIALAGNPNVGKSVIFNQLTGLSQTIGNWPGKTVEKMEGHLDFLGYRFNIVDLPGIYSLSTFSLEEIVSREYIISEEVDIIINVIDGTNLERNLFFTFQLLELEVPIILAINQMDIVRKKNIAFDFKELEKIFKLPILPVVAVHGIGVHQLLEEVIELYIYRRPQYHYVKNEDKTKELTREEKKTDIDVNDLELEQRFRDFISRNSISVKEAFKFPNLSSILTYGKEVEIKIRELKKEIEACQDYFSQYNYPSRFLAIKVLEDDKEIEKLFKTNEEACKIIEIAEKNRKELEDYHGEDIHTIISSEIYNNIHKIIEKVVISKSPETRKESFAERIDHLTTHSVWGYVILILVILGIYIFTFSIGDFFGGLLDELYGIWSENIHEIHGEDNLLIKIFWDGGLGGFFGAVGGVLIYVVPFFLVIEILQDSGYLPRAAFLMDRMMHFLGVHGKTIIPMILGFGCNVPACAGCRIMETEREKRISIVLSSLVPCAAVMTVVLGLVGRYLGLIWVLILFVINFSVIILVGRILNKIMPGQCTELIMEMHEYRVPNYSVITKQTWLRAKEFIFKSLPLIVIIGIFLEIMLIFNLLEPVNIILSPITILLGLPIITGIFLIYGILRKELTLVLLVVLANSMGLTLLELLTPIQMIIFSLVTMLYIPCFATIIIIAKQTNWKYAIQISIMEIGIALLIGGAINFGFILFTSF